MQGESRRGKRKRGNHLSLDYDFWFHNGEKKKQPKRTGRVISSAHKSGVEKKERKKEKKGRRSPTHWSRRRRRKTGGREETLFY